MELDEKLARAKIGKLEAETAVAIQQLRDLENAAKSHIIQRVFQGVGAGLVIALAGFALFQPIIDAQKAIVTKDSEIAKRTSELAALDAKIVSQKNKELKVAFKEREDSLQDQQEQYESNLKNLSEDLKKANKDLDEAIKRNEVLVTREKELASKYEQLSQSQVEETDFKRLAEEAEERARALEQEVQLLRDKAVSTKAIVKTVQEKIDYGPLRLLPSSIQLWGKSARSLIPRLSSLGIRYSELSYESCTKNKKIGYHPSNRDSAVLLQNLIKEQTGQVFILLNNPHFSSGLLQVCWK